MSALRDWLHRERWASNAALLASGELPTRESQADDPPRERTCYVCYMRVGDERALLGSPAS